MVFATDAECLFITECEISDRNINKEVLRKIEDDLDVDEKVSLLFLMVEDYTCAFGEVNGLLNKLKDQDAYIITEFVEKYSQNWKIRLLEAICILQNRQIVKKLGISFRELELLYMPKNRLCARNLNPIVKCLYILCEALSEDETRLLIENVKANCMEYDINIDNTNCLELHMLYWMEKNYISIHSDGRANLKSLLKNLKQFVELEHIYDDLKKCENEQNVLDNQQTSFLNTPQLQVPEPQVPQPFTSGALNSVAYCKTEYVKKIKTGLCIIINQMFFRGKKYTTRFGTTADCLKLKQTFKGFGFDVYVYEDLEKEEMLQRMKNIPKDFGTSYDCIFVCILSHGCKGSIITTDEEEVSIETLENEICCLELKDVVKVIIIQACQGQTTGQRSPLTTDGPSERNVSNITRFRNCCIFMSTMQGFVSVRHQEQGSWFIQELCATFQDEGSKLTFSQAVRRIMQQVEKKSGILGGVDCIAQLPELRSYRLFTDFQLPEYRAQPS